jgi:hypothetical protein
MFGPICCRYGPYGVKREMDQSSIPSGVKTKRGQLEEKTFEVTDNHKPVSEK